MGSTSVRSPTLRERRPAASCSRRRAGLDGLAGALRDALPGFLWCAPPPAAGGPSAGAGSVERVHVAVRVTSSSRYRIGGRLGFSAKTFNRLNSLAASGSSRADLNTASRPLSQNQHFRSTSSIFSCSISKVSHCSSAAASSSRATASACVIAPNRAGSRA